MQDRFIPSWALKNIWHIFTFTVRLRMWWIDADTLPITLTPCLSRICPHFAPRTIRGARPGQNVQWIYLKTQQLLLHPPRPAPLFPRRTPLSETWIRVNVSHPTPSNTMVKVYAEINLCNIIRLSTHRPSSSGSQPSKQESVPLSALWGPSIFVKRHWAKVADTVFCHLGNL